MDEVLRRINCSEEQGQEIKNEFVGAIDYRQLLEHIISETAAPLEEEETGDKHFCSECNCRMTHLAEQMEYMCDKCGSVVKDVSHTVDSVGGTNHINNYNTSDESATPIMINGPNHYYYQKKLVSSASNYKKTQKRNTVKQMVGYTYEKQQVAQHIVLQAADLYYEVQQHCIKRGEVRRGTMAACLYRVCKYEGHPRKPKEIAAIFGTDRSEVSNGIKILDGLLSQRRLVLKGRLADYNPYFDGINHTMDYLKRYFNALQIDERYKEFAERLVRFTTKYGISHSSNTSSKCAGVIYIIITRVPELRLGEDAIKRECNISPSTFRRFAKCIFDFLGPVDTTNQGAVLIKRRLRHLFIKHGINPNI